jgi:succinate dehydrogenase hydrophobic anchor subunit
VSIGAHPSLVPSTPVFAWSRLSHASLPVHLPLAPADLLKFENASTLKDLMHASSFFLAAGIPLAVMIGSPVSSVVDLVAGVVIPLHAHVGMRSVLFDYVHDVPTQRMTLGALAIFTAGSAIGLTWFNVTDVGLTEGVTSLFVRPKAE